MTTVKQNNSQDRAARMAHGLGAAVGTFIVATVAMAIGIYLTGGNGTEVASGSQDPLTFFSATNEAAFGVASAVMALVMGLVGLVTAAGTAIVSIALGAFGIVGAVVITAGVVTGPILLVAAVVILVRRRFFPDVI
jgi:hypothetical protein